MQSQGTGATARRPSRWSPAQTTDGGPAAEHDFLAHLADETDRAIAALPAISLWRPWLAQVSRVLRAGAGLRVIRAVARRGGGEVA